MEINFLFLQLKFLTKKIKKNVKKIRRKNKKLIYVFYLTFNPSRQATHL
jgi:hypothetical protein